MFSKQISEEAYKWAKQTTM